MPTSAATVVADTHFVLERHFSAAPARVWDALTQPAALNQWFGPVGTTIDVVEVDLRVGGQFRIVMRSPSNEMHSVSGRYQGIIVQQKLVFSWAWAATPTDESLVTCTLDQDGSGTLLRLMHERLRDRSATTSHLDGWTSSLIKLAALLS